MKNSFHEKNLDWGKSELVLDQNVSGSGLSVNVWNGNMFTGDED